MGFGVGDVVAKKVEGADVSGNELTDGTGVGSVCW